MAEIHLGEDDFHQGSINDLYAIVPSNASVSNSTRSTFNSRAKKAYTPPLMSYKQRTKYALYQPNTRSMSGLFAFLVAFFLVIAVIRFLYNGQGFSVQSFLEFLQTVEFTDLSSVYQWTASAVWAPDWGAFDWLGEFFAMIWNSLLSVVDVSTFISNGAVNVIEVCIQFIKYLF